MTTDSLTLSINQAETFIAKALQASGVSTQNAASVAQALVAAEVDGQSGHGFSRVAGYAAQARCGKVNGTAKPKIEQKAPAVIAVDAANGFAFPAIDLAIAELSALAPTTGVACATIYRSHHGGQLGVHVEKLAKNGLMALMFANTPKAMAPWGGSQALFGTNPIAFAAPRQAQEPLVIDLSLSKVARGKVMAAAKAGEAIPQGWALDKHGRPTTDPAAALEGTMLPAGDVKGASLALMVEIFAATLTGANYSFEASSFLNSEGPPPEVGQTIIAFSCEKISGDNFGERLEVLVSAIEAQDGARLPGSRRAEIRAAAEKTGLSVPMHLYSEIEALIGS